MVNNQRVQQTAEKMRRELAAILRDEVNDPRITFLVSVTDVKLSNDLSYARIFVSVLGSEEQNKLAMEGLKHALGFVRRELASRLKLRKVPELTFHLDTSIEYGTRINQLLKEVSSPGTALEVPPGEDRGEEKS